MIVIIVIQTVKIQVHQVCKTVSEFSLEFRTTRDRYFFLER